jgi:hypothetical protein
METVGFDMLVRVTIFSYDIDEMSFSLWPSVSHSIRGSHSRFPVERSFKSYVWDPGVGTTSGIRELPLQIILIPFSPTMVSVVPPKLADLRLTFGTNS